LNQGGPLRGALCSRDSYQLRPESLEEHGHDDEEGHDFFR